MPLQNQQYDAIMREYSRRQAEAQRIARIRREEVEALEPRLKDIDQQVAASGAGCVREVLSGKPKDLSSLRERLSSLSREREALLAARGYPPDYLEPPYTCPKCSDTGYIGREKCTCLRQAEQTVLYDQAGLSQILERESFSSFSLDYYDQELYHEATGQSARRMAERALEAAKTFVNTFDESFQNLFLYGDTGVGKTFLSHCIAGALLASSHSVLYFSSHDLFERLRGYAFAREDTPGSLSDLLDCDLLIIDDLGTELTNSFVSSQLFLCVNERLLRQRSTLISTNLKLEDFSSVYSERTFSRIAGNYQMIKLIGQDIRLQKALS